MKGALFGLALGGLFAVASAVGGSTIGCSSSSSGGATPATCDQGGGANCSEGSPLQFCYQGPTRAACTSGYWQIGSQTIPCQSCSSADLAACQTAAIKACGTVTSSSGGDGGSSSGGSSGSSSGSSSGGGSGSGSGSSSGGGDAASSSSGSDAAAD